MTISESMKRFKVGMRVYDRWWFWEIGRVVRVGKTRLRVQFPDRPVQFPSGLVSYDAAHSRFLEVTR